MGTPWKQWTVQLKDVHSVGRVLLRKDSLVPPKAKLSTHWPENALGRLGSGYNRKPLIDSPLKLHVVNNNQAVFHSISSQTVVVAQRPMQLSLPSLPLFPLQMILFSYFVLFGIQE